MLRYIYTLTLLLFATSSWAQTYSLGGQIATDSGETMGNVSLEIVDVDGNTVASATTDCSGDYLFSDLDAGVSYTLRVEKEGSPLNGNSTFDLVLISRHLLGIQSLPNVYRTVAADIDESGNVSVMDLLRLRAVILYIEESFGNRNWLFFRPGDLAASADYDFVLNNDLLNFDLIGIKKGDVNDTAIPCE